MRSSLYARHALAAGLSALFITVASTAWAQLPSFNGAEGYGGTFAGSAPVGGWFSNAEIYHVTTTQDLMANGKGAAGTLRGAFVDFTNPSSPKQKATNRIVVFDVGGTFELLSANGKLDMKEINNIYVAGQTAPSPVTVYGSMSQITKSGNTFTSNVILRYMTFRKGTGDEEDAISFTGGDGDTDTVANNMILDHVTASWAEDENISVTNNNSNVTVQYSIIHDALVNNHAYGSLIRPKVSANVTFHHNLYANNASRQARFGSYNSETLTADFRNNVVYNYRDRASYAGGSTEAEQEFANVDYVGNYIVAGPGTGSNLSTYGGEYVFRVDKNITAQVYQSGNYLDADMGPGGAASDTILDGSNTGAAMFVVTTPVTDQSLTLVGTPFSTSAVTTQTAPEAYNQVTSYAGNSWSARDVIDTRVINNVLNFTGPALAAAAPIGSELTYVTSGAYPNAPTTRPGGYDSDNDGMPNDWETKHGLNPNSNADKGLDFDSDGYVNIQEYLDEVGAFPAPSSITFNGATNTRYAQITNWKTADLVDGSITYSGTNWQPTKYDEARINSGTVVVDAVGQHAGNLKLGATAGSNGQLQINSGWLEVAHTVYVGAHATGQGTLTLGAGQLSAENVQIGFLGQLRGNGTLTGNVNNGGAVLPGNSPGTITVNGNYTQTGDGVLSIDLASLASFDKLVVNGNITYGGLLEVLSPSYSPVLNDSFNIIDWTGMKSGFFDALSLPDLDDGLDWDLSQLDTAGVLSVIAAAPEGLAGDYNGDDVVDALDYTVWRNNFGDATEDNIANNGDGMNGVDEADFDWWKLHYGDTLGPGGGGLAGVPEPTCLLLGMIGLALAVCRGRKR